MDNCSNYKFSHTLRSGEMIFKSRYWVFFGGQCGTSIFPSFMVRQLDLQTMIWTDISGSLSGASIPEMSSMSCKSMTHHLIFRHKTIGEWDYHLRWPQNWGFRNTRWNLSYRVFSHLKRDMCRNQNHCHIAHTTFGSNIFWSRSQRQFHVSKWWNNRS